MKIIGLILIIIPIIFYGGCSSSSNYSKQATWNDEFNKNGSPNPNMWTRSVTKPGVQLSAYCDDDSNAYVKNGMLHLRIYKTGDPENPYKAGRVIIGKDFHFKKGKLEVRAKAPLTAGLWPAIWLNGPKTKKGFFVELDIMEHIHAMGDSCYEASYHLWGDFGGKKKNHASYGQIVPVNVGEWHVYTLEISDDKIIMKVDGQIVYDIYRGKYGKEWPEDQEFSLRLYC